jgi:hypothetical protein
VDRRLTRKNINSRRKKRAAGTEGRCGTSEEENQEERKSRQRERDIDREGERKRKEVEEKLDRELKVWRGLNSSVTR